MAYNVSQEFRDKLYSGSSEFDCQLTIGGVEIPIDQISSISISSPIIDDRNEAFYIGTFISQKLTIKFRNMDFINVESGQEVSLSIGQLVDGEYVYVPIGLYIVDELAENYHKTCEITCLDYAIKFKPNIDYAPCFVDGKATIDTILAYICEHFGVELGDYPEINGDIEIGTYDNTISGKQYISYIAELKGCNAKMDREGRLTLQPLKQVSNIPINALESKSFELGERYNISKVTYYDAIRNFTFGDDTGSTLFIRQENPFIVNEEAVENIYDEIEGFEIYNLECQNYGDFTLDAWDLLEYSTDEGTYVTWNNNTLTYAMTIMGTVKTKIPTKQQVATTNVVDANIRTVKTTVDNVNNKVNIEVAEIHNTLDSQDERVSSLEISNEQIVSTVSDMEDTVEEQNNKISQVSQRADELDLKISDIADVTVSGESTMGIVQLDNANESSPAYIKVHPINDDIARLYPYTKLYPSSDLYPRPKNVIQFTNTVTDEVFEYELPQNLYWLDENTYDEFVLSYNDKSCQVVKRVTYDSNGNKVALAEPQYVDLPYVEEPDLTAGDYIVELLNYTSAYLKVRLIASNYYTTQFATKAELRLTANDITSTVQRDYTTKEETEYIENSLYSEIEQTAEDINLEVGRKVGKDEIISRINASPEQISINSGKISLAGKTINMTSDNIAINSTNFKVDKNGNVTANNIKATNADLSGRITATSGTIGKCSIDSNGNLVVKNANIESINGNKVSGGTIDGRYTNMTNLSGGNISSGTISKGGINYQAYNSSTGQTFLIAGANYAYNPYVSALNVGYGHGGISFRTTNGPNSTGNENAYIHTTEANGALYINGSNGVNVAGIRFYSNYIHIGDHVSGEDREINIGSHYINAGHGGQIDMHSSSGGNLVLYGGGKVRAGGNTASNNVATSSSGPSSRNVKENIKDISKDYKKIYEDLKDVNMYTYDYKYEGIKENKNDYGFIIDEIEDTKTLSKYFRNYDTELYLKNNKVVTQSYSDEDMSVYDELDIKEWERDAYIKGLFIVIKSLQNEIEDLKQEVQELQELKENIK